MSPPVYETTLCSPVKMSRDWKISLCRWVCVSVCVYRRSVLHHCEMFCCLQPLSSSQRVNIFIFWLQWCWNSVWFVCTHVVGCFYVYLFSYRFRGFWIIYTKTRRLQVPLTISMHTGISVFSSLKKNQLLSKHFLSFTQISSTLTLHTPSHLNSLFYVQNVCLRCALLFSCISIATF